MQKFDYSLNHYHFEKDSMPGAYEWWYFDGDLDNRYVFNIVFSCTNPTGARYAQALAKIAKDPATPYNALDYATMKVVIADEKRNPLFQGEFDLNADQVRIARDKLDVYFGDKCHLSTVDKGEYPDFVVDVEIPDGKGNTIKADVVFSPLIGGIKVGRGALIEAEVGGRNLYQRWLVTVPKAAVKANFVITNADGSKIIIKEKGYGYHDHNWGNHPISATLERWYWGRIAESDLNITYSKVFNLVSSFKSFTPCIFIHQGKLVYGGEGIELTEGEVRPGVQGLNYAQEVVVNFLEESGISGTLKISDLHLIAEQNCYLRFNNHYELDVETAGGKIRKSGRGMFEYMDLVAAVKLMRAKMMAAVQK